MMAFPLSLAGYQALYGFCSTGEGPFGPERRRLGILSGPADHRVPGKAGYEGAYELPRCTFWNFSA